MEIYLGLLEIKIPKGISTRFHTRGAKVHVSIIFCKSFTVLTAFTSIRSGHKLESVLPSSS
jgi:hypothetical protein